MPTGRVADDGIGIDFESVLSTQLGHPLPGSVAVEHDAGTFRPENDVLGDGEARDEHEVLVDHGQPGEHGVARVLESDRLTVDQNLALIGVIQPEEDVHQGRLAGAVFAEQGVDLALLDGELDAVVGNDTGESFDDSPHFDRRRRPVEDAISHERVQNSPVPVGRERGHCSRRRLPSQPPHPSPIAMGEGSWASDGVTALSWVEVAAKPATPIPLLRERG